MTDLNIVDYPISGFPESVSFVLSGNVIVVVLLKSIISYLLGIKSRYSRGFLFF